MPELPEVETVCRSLRQCLPGRTIIQGQVFLPKIIKIPQENLFCQQICGLQIKAVHRRGKYILLELSQDMTLVVHLRMTGKLLWQASDSPRAKHTHIILQLDNGYDLRFDDTRQFGTMYLVNTGELDQISGLHALGLEPVSEEFTLEAFCQMAVGKKQKAKVFLLDQRFVAGIGNIYADEILFQARIHPETAINCLTQEELVLLWQAIGNQLRQGIFYGGSSIKDYVDSFGQAGTFQQHHKVYGRGEQPCIECGTRLEKIKIGGRSTCFCPNCQIRR